MISVLVTYIIAMVVLGLFMLFIQAIEHDGERDHARVVRRYMLYMVFSFAVYPVLLGQLLVQATGELIEDLRAGHDEF